MVQTSDRVEAFARGLGFRTYASLRAVLDEDGCVTPPRRPKGSEFSEYLESRGYEVDRQFCLGVFFSSLGELPEAWKTAVGPDHKVTRFYRGTGLVGVSVMGTHPGADIMQENVSRYLAS
jgi:hypothetical protein